MSTIVLSRRPRSEEERAERRAREREQMREAVEALRSGEGWRRWLDVRRHFHDYSFHNQLLIATQCPEATRVAGFRRWLTLGYCIRKGEKAIRIWAPCPPSRKQVARWREAGADPEQQPRTWFRLVPVFNRSQVEPLPEFDGERVELDPPVVPVTGDSLAPLIEPLVVFAATFDSRVDFASIPGSATGSFSPSTRVITVDGPCPNGRVKTLLHELSHLLVRCERAEEDPELSYGEEEAVVECVAFCVCSALGFDTSGYSVAYVAGWGEGDEIERYAALIDRLARRLEEVVLVDPESAREEEDEAAVA